VPGKPETRQAALALASSRCMPAYFQRVQLRFDAELFRASLLSAMYQHDFRRAGIPDVASLPPLTISSEFDAPEKDIPLPLVFTRILGDCAARADSARVHALLLTRIGSRQERPALDNVMPVLRNCLAAGRELRFSRSMLRGFLAEALYKLRKSAAGTAVQPERASS
jgi:hypothetical protein